SVSISWIAAERASLYIIERRTPQTNWIAVGQTAVGQTYYIDQTAEPATIYSYRVTARNANGDSAPSNYTIVNTWSTLADWRFQNYGTLNNQGVASSLADNGTGVPNLFKFAFNMSASDRFYEVHSQGGIKGMPNIQLQSESGLLQVAFIRRRAERNPGIVYSVEYSNNLTSWAVAGREILTAAIDEDFEYVVWEDDPVTEGARTSRFARVKVVE
ncbi:MAG: fibronectin type III domain-containing protein, partial [Rariglobus sp.]